MTSHAAVSWLQPPGATDGPGAIFLDRDGTLNEDRGYVHKPCDVAALPGAGEVLLEWAQRGYRLFLITNQSGIGRGWYTLHDVRATNARLWELCGVRESIFSGICIAPEPQDGLAGYRKPSPRFILEARQRYRLDPRRCWLAGDRPADWLAAVFSGIRPVALRSGQAFDERARAILGRYAEVVVYPSLQEFAAGLRTEAASLH